MIPLLQTTYGGVPIDLIAIIFLVFLAVMGIALKFAGRKLGQIAVKLIWVFKNYQALKIDAKEDLRGIFIHVLGARGKEIETIKKAGQPIEVESIDLKDMKAYILLKGDKKVARGKLTEQDVQTGEDGKPLAYITVKRGRSTIERTYITVEGTGRTFDPIKGAEGVEDPGNAPVIQEEQSAFKTIMRLFSEAAESAANKLFTFATGIGTGAGAIMIVLLLLGHLR